MVALPVPGGPGESGGPGDFQAPQVVMSKKPTTNELREAFLAFFESKGHRRVPSSPLVPMLAPGRTDETLLFTNAGMNQFKRTFLGEEKRDYVRASSCQKCVRAGGKHNDLENVGRTTRHHTFFEMLGNFSFGDYFKKEAIAHAWEFLTSEKWMGIPQRRLWVTIHDSDDEAEGFWFEALMAGGAFSEAEAKDRIRRMGDADNFWQMGDTGPCGPCSEIHYDSSDTWEKSPGGGPGSKNDDGERYLEVWNLVFMQFEQKESGERTPLPRPSIDTGMGLERIARVMQGVGSNFETDSIKAIIDHGAKLSGKSYEKDDEETRVSLRVLADHARAGTFLIGDGVMPGNEGRGYVLRRILRRAIRHGKKLGMEKPFLYELAGTVIEQMKGAYPELADAGKAANIADAIRTEEERFLETLDNGLKELYGMLMHEVDVLARNISNSDPHAKDRLYLLELTKQIFEGRKRQVEAGAAYDINHSGLGVVEQLEEWHRTRQKMIDLSVKPNVPALKGEDAFKLYDTFGFPVDMVQVMGQEPPFFGISMPEFYKQMEEQRERSRAARGKVSAAADEMYASYGNLQTGFDGYKATRAEARLLHILRDGSEVNPARAGDEVQLVFDHTPFYGESGGQVGDAGMIEGKGVRVRVTDTQKPLEGLIVHHAVVEEGTLAADESYTLVVDELRRARIRRNHSATHLLHAALRKTLGTHVQQAGSMVAPERLRFDFSHPKRVSDDEIATIERLVNEEVERDVDVDVSEKSFDDAIKSGAMALFGEKYGDAVRVVQMGGFSTELCGGTHVSHTGDIGLFKIVREEAVAGGTRRIVALTGDTALAELRKSETLLREVAEALKAAPEEAAARAEKILEENRKLAEQVADLKRKLATGGGGGADWRSKVEEIGGVKVLIHRADGLDGKALRELADQGRAHLGSGVTIVGSENEGKALLLVAVTDDVKSKVHSGNLVKELAPLIGGKGGGKPDFAQAGGGNPDGLDSALSKAREIIAG